MKNKSKLLKILPYIFLALGLIVGAYRLYYFLNSNIPLGYDAGIYKIIFQTYEGFLQTGNREIFPAWMKQEPLIGAIAAGLKSLGISYDFMVTWGVGILSLLPGILLFFIFKKYHTNLGVIIAILYWISITQYNLFWFNYIKQILGISIMLFAIYALQYKKNILFALGFLLAILLHRHTALYIVFASIIYVILQSIQHKKIPHNTLFTIGLISLAGITIYIPFWNKLVADVLPALKTTFMGQGYGGMFINKNSYLNYNYVVFFLSIIGIFLKIKERNLSIGAAGYLAGALWIGLGIINFNRTIAFFDIFVIILAGYTMYKLINFHKIFGSIATVAIIGFVTTQYLYYVHSSSIPLINNYEFESIKELDTITEPRAVIMNTDKYYTTWIMGYSNRNWISPGWSDLNLWNEEERNQWRTSDGYAKCKMMIPYRDYTRPIYIWEGENQPRQNWENQYCLEEVKRENGYVLYKYIYSRTKDDIN